MNVLAVLMKYDYGNQNVGYSFEYENFFKTLLYMKNINVELFDFLSYEQAFGRDKMNELLVNKVKQSSYDLIFFCLYQENFYLDTLKLLMNRSITYNWFCDDHWRFDDFSSKYAPYFTYVSTTDEDAMSKYLDKQISHVFLTQWACNQNDYEKLNLSKIYDCSFIGQPHTNRRSIVKFIRSKGLKVDVFGKDWVKLSWFEKQKKSIYKKFFNQNLYSINSGFISQFDMIKIFNQTKINLNFSGNRKSQQIKGRNFEIPGTGNFMISEHAKYLEKYYDLKNEVPVFESYDEMIDMIKYYLNHDEERETIAANALNRTLKEHTYEKRFLELFSKMNLSNLE